MRPTGLLAIALAAFAAAPAAPAVAQTAISGRVADSVAGRPLAGASVQLVVEDEPLKLRTVVSDSDGAYRFDAVPPGRYLLGFLHPRLDDFALQPPVRRVEVQGGMASLVSNFAIPGTRTLATAVCGARKDSTGLLIGRVADARGEGPVDTAIVTASWREFRADGGGLRLERRILNARVTSESAGGFALCGIPGNAFVIVRATAGARESGEVELIVPAGGLLYRNLLVASAARAGSETAALAGHVYGPDGKPVARAVVAMQDGAASDTTDDAGAFALAALRPGTRALEARALGFVPKRLAVDLRTGATATADVVLDEAAPELEVVTVYGKAPVKRRDWTGFLERQRWGFGHFMSAKEIEQAHARALPDLLATTPGLRIAYRPAGSATIFSRGTRDMSSRCMPDVFLDGMIVHDGANIISDIVRPHEIMGIEVYASSTGTPAEFLKGPCGALVIWTKRGRER